jgi:hypothetical protein
VASEIRHHGLGIVVARFGVGRELPKELTYLVGGGDEAGSLANNVEIPRSTRCIHPA